MRILVDMSKCQNHGQCTISAPDYFELNDQGELQHRTEFDQEDLGDIEDAADSCPMQAIVIDSGPEPT
ncbi:ferredoxin [Janibacter melonis]|uniref:ferredoxin n=1 Tax=Janibacter melonis TaxID=262209 RepID=UPI003555D898